MKLIANKIERFIAKNGVTVRRHPLPACKGLAKKAKDGYLILVDDRLDNAQALDVLLHELMHIKLGHFDGRQDLPEWLKEKEVAQALEELEI